MAEAGLYFKLIFNKRIVNNTLRISCHLESLHHPLTQTAPLRLITGGLLRLDDPTWTQAHPAEAACPLQTEAVAVNNVIHSAPCPTSVFTAVGCHGEMDGGGDVSCRGKRTLLTQATPADDAQPPWHWCTLMTLVPQQKLISN